MITVNGELIKSVDLDRDKFHLVDLAIARNVQTKNDGDFTYMLIELMLLDAVSPKDAGLSQDTRRLGIALRAISVF